MEEASRYVSGSVICWVRVLKAVSDGGDSVE